MATSEGRGRRRERLLYLYSTRNIVGSLLALVGLGLFFAGVIGWIWPLVVLALYLIGVLVVPKPRAVDLHGDVDTADMRRELQAMLKRIRGRVPNDIQSKVAAIAATIEGLLPGLDQFPPGSQELFVLERTVEDYLPTALEAYLNLPRVYATVHPIQGGKTARQVLSDQLDLLQSQMDQVADALARNDTDKLLAHGRFLEERFGRKALSLDPDDGQGPPMPPPSPPEGPST